jgi:hypothetical protein
VRRISLGPKHSRRNRFIVLRHAPMACLTRRTSAGVNVDRPFGAADDADLHVSTGHFDTFGVASLPQSTFRRRLRGAFGDLGTRVVEDGAHGLFAGPFARHPHQSRDLDELVAELGVAVAAVRTRSQRQALQRSADDGGADLSDSAGTFRARRRSRLMLQAWRRPISCGGLGRENLAGYETP